MTLTIAQISKWLSSKRTEGGDCASGVTSSTACPGAVSRTTACVPREALRVSVTPQLQNALFGETRRQNAPFRRVAAPGRCGATPRQAAGHYGECLNWANALEQPPAGLRGGLREGPQISVRSLASRKGAVCVAARTQSALFGETRRQNALFRRAPPRLPR